MKLPSATQTLTLFLQYVLLGSLPTQSKLENSFVSIKTHLRKYVKISMTLLCVFGAWYMAPPQ